MKLVGQEIRCDCGGTIECRVTVVTLNEVEWDNGRLIVLETDGMLDYENYTFFCEMCHSEWAKEEIENELGES